MELEDSQIENVRSYCLYIFTSSIQPITVPRGAHMKSSSLICRRQFHRRSSLICRPALLRRAHMGDISLLCGPPLRRQAYMGSLCLSADHESPDQLCPFELHSPHLQGEVGTFTADPSVDRRVLPFRITSSPVMRSDWRCQTCDVRAKTCGVHDGILDEISRNNCSANS